MRKYQRFTQAEKLFHLKVRKEQNLSQKAYCELHDIAVTTYQYWEKKYRNYPLSNDNSDIAKGFIPVKVQSGLGERSQLSDRNHLHFLFPNGIQVMCPESVRPELLKMLLTP